MTTTARPSPSAGASLLENMAQQEREGSRAFARTYLMVGTLVLGAYLIGMGAFMSISGLNAQSELTAAMNQERVETGDPRISLTYEGARAPAGVTIPKVLINTPELARAEALVLNTHVQTSTGGKSWSEIPSKIADPNDASKQIDNPLRATYIQGMTLQTALNVAYMGFNLTNLVLAVGVSMIVLGVGVIALGTPAIHWSTKRA